ncbi:MAG: FprA family A-type flavoprotein [Methanocellales archaeon]|nr:FprA family A-type flavoprotein [Methanocellales archaeon]MDD3292128.1 FprA family A-type flavoprotein [Methanocellales archaeon]MDD5235365.1 FprA family A-type flavoprotein [Methanocellales archaeon]MDD5485687.1 FprA family A-type flavoprotein [Methanocellales archaeon]
MKPRELKPDIYSIGAVDWDRRLFDELIPLPDGTSYNSYLVKGSEKTALIDTVDPTMGDVLIKNLNQLDIKDIDYIIVNHAEQDHSGYLPQIIDAYPDAKVVTNPKCKALLRDLLAIPENKFITVDDGGILSLGDKTLEFIYAPWVHWPETMLTYLREDRILFPCDLFGSHLATSDLYVTDEATVYESAKRYYAEIMMPFRTTLQKNLEKIKDLEIDLIAPSHGPIYANPKFILEAYRHWVLDLPDNTVVVPYVSMHGSTKEMVDYFVGALTERGITVKQFKLSNTDIGKLAMTLVDAATVVMGVPTTLAGAHPLAFYAAYLVKVLRPKLKFVSIIGSYSWGGKAVEQLAEIISSLDVEILDPVYCKGFPRTKDFESLDKLADTIYKKHQEMSL